MAMLERTSAFCSQVGEGLYDAVIESLRHEYYFTFRRIVFPPHELSFNGLAFPIAMWKLNRLCLCIIYTSFNPIHFYYFVFHYFFV